MLIGSVVIRSSVWVVFIYIILCQMHQFGNVRSSTNILDNCVGMSPHFLLGERSILGVLDDVHNQVLHLRHVENRNSKTSLTIPRL